MESLTSCGKKSFILYNEWSLVFNMLTDIQAGKLIKLIYAFVNDDPMPECEMLVKVAFEPIRQCIIRDQEKWSLMREKQAMNGRLGGRPRKINELTENPMVTEENPKNPPVNSETQKSLYVNVNDNDNDNDNGKEIEKEQKEKKRKKQEADFLTKIIGAFQDAYFFANNYTYVITAMGKERAAAQKILEIYKTKYPGAPGDEVLQGLKAYFEDCCLIQDEWLQSKMSLSIIVSKFNEINQILKLKNGKQTNTGRTNKHRDVASRSAEIDAIVDAVFNAKDTD